jgi:lipoprotein-anchoring transpeptidase ErfK/SrfK
MTLYDTRRTPLAERASLPLLAAITFLLCASVATAAPEADKPTVNPVSELTLAWQIALERLGFSPGLIDGQFGPKTRLAIAEFQRVRSLSVTGEADDATAKALGLHPGHPDAVQTYTVTERDLTEVGPLPDGWVQKSKAKRLPYPTVQEMLAEKFHTKQSTLAALNGLTLEAWVARTIRAGDSIRTPKLAAPVPPATAKRLEVNLDEKVIRVIGENNRLEALFHCSVAAKEEKLPTGRARVTVITHGPSYLFDPEMWPEVRGIDRKLLIPPGPRSPVGLCWIGLSLPGYGMHGSPTPEMIGKTGSHGCFRLTNWDACRLALMVRVGTPVVFQRTEVESLPAVQVAQGKSNQL